MIQRCMISLTIWAWDKLSWSPSISRSHPLIGCRNMIVLLDGKSSNFGFLPFGLYINFICLMSKNYLINLRMKSEYP